MLSKTHQNQIRLILQDYALMVAIGLNMATHFLTNFAVSTIQTATASANAIETNPVVKAQSQSYLLQTIFLALMYALITALYLYMRRNRGQSNSNNFTFNLYTLMILILWATDFMQDLGIVFGLILHT